MAIEEVGKKVQKEEVALKTKAPPRETKTENPLKDEEPVKIDLKRKSEESEKTATVYQKKQSAPPPEEQPEPEVAVQSKAYEPEAEKVVSEKPEAPPPRAKAAAQTELPAPKVEAKKTESVDSVALQSSIEKVSEAAGNVIEATRVEQSSVTKLRSGENEVRNVKVAEELAKQIAFQVKESSIESGEAPNPNPSLSPSRVKELTLTQQVPTSVPKGLTG